MRDRRFWLMCWLISVLLLAGCATSAAASRPHATAAPSVTPSVTPAALLPVVGTVTQTLRLAPAPAACPVDAAWSPDGAQVAVLATRDTCLVRPAMKMPDLIIIYDARTGAIVRQISLAATLDHLKADVMIEPMFGFSGLSWSPNGALIAVPFFQYIVLSSNPRGMGALVASTRTGSVRALLGSTNFGSDPTGVDRFSAATVWNVAAGTQAASVAIPLPAAPAYRWSADGQITPAAGGSLSYWQPGFIAAVPVNGDNALAANYYYYANETTRWSPDSHYVVAGLMTMNLAGKSANAPATIAPKMCREERWPQPCNDQPIPQSDAAFRVALAAVNQAAHMLYPDTALVAWRPNGGELATVLPGNDVNREHRAITITLFETATGRALGAVSVPIAATQGDTGMTVWPYVSWSPTGQQLAVVDNVDNTIQLVTLR